MRSSHRPTWRRCRGPIRSVGAAGAAKATRRGRSGSGCGSSGRTVEKLKFRYRIDGDDPPWRPLRAFDDGDKVFIQFPSGLAQGEAPPLFVHRARREAALVNYRVRGPYYIVDRLFGAAELRLGIKPQHVVRIVRTDAVWRETKQ